MKFYTTALKYCITNILGIPITSAIPGNSYLVYYRIEH